jgi:hypothetical protein
VSRALKLSPTETAQITQMLDDGLPVAEIVERSGRSINAVHQIRRDVNRERRAFTEAENGIIRSLYGIKSTKEIATILGRSSDAEGVRVQIMVLGLNKKARKEIPISVKAVTASLLTAAAQRRGMLPGDLLSEMVEGVFRRSNVPIDRLLSGRTLHPAQTSGVAE